MSKSRGIMMTDESVRAILAGTKTQTRRVVNTRHPLSYIGPLGEEHNPSNWGWFFDGPDHNGYMVLGRGHNDRQNHGSISIRSPYGEVGDALWIREAWRSWRRTCEQDGGHEDEDEPCAEHCDQTYVAYRATPRIGYRPVPDKQRICYLDESSPIEDDKRLLGPWKSPMFMPRFASRIALEVVDVRVQRLQQISEDDARFERVEFGTKQPALINGEPGHAAFFNARDAYAYRWEAINGKREPWKSDPFVWAISFRRVTP